MKRVALIGCGEISKMHTNDFNVLSDIITPVGFCDVIRERAEAANERCGGVAKVYTDYKMMLDEVKPDIVFIAVPPYCHGEMEFELIERNIPFMVQKPMALDIKLAKRIRDAIEEKGLVVGVYLQTRYSNYSEAARAFCKKNNIVHIDCTRIQGPAVPPTTAEWWGQKALSGGQMVESGIHNIDLLRYYMDAEVTEVSAFATKGFVKGYDNFDIDEDVTAILKFDNGAIAMVGSGAYATNGKYAYPNRTLLSACDKRAEMVMGRGTTIYGEVEATAESVKRDYGEVAELREDGTIFVPRANNPSPDCTRTFVEAVISGDTSKIRSTYADAYKTLAFLLACNESIETGKTIKVEY